MRLVRLKIANPCSVAWDSMSGDGRVRLCPTCDKHVYNVIQLSRRELDRLIAKHEGALPCMRIYWRSDGTVMTRRCAQSMRWAAQLVWWRMSVAAAFLFAFLASGLARFGGAIAAATTPPDGADHPSDTNPPRTPKPPKPKKKPEPPEPPPPPQAPLGGAPMID